MQIPLDFYRILGVPHRATLEQLQQAFDDRLQQLPRQEYSSAAIAARKQILEDAFVMLADPQKRQDYDVKLIAQDAVATSESFSGLDTDTSEKKLAGVLLLLQEVGAYAQILGIGAAYFERPIDLTKPPAGTSTPEDDVILAMALAHLELGREQWQQSEFEPAGVSLQAGLDLLEREQRFPGIQEDIRGDLFKLRPYRILEALDDEAPEQRQKGLTLLQAMLNDRDGIDGNQDDQSGLIVNDFLRFVQQLREYLTVEEQQTLFELEAARPSAVASYLAVYALIARGVSENTPSLIQRAKALLTQLKDRQDVAIEVGMCWLLLGQPGAAHQNVLLSQDQESLAFMQQYSNGAPDLIPGLYLYTENWLQQEVYPYFRDLLGHKVSLQDYFNNPEVQSILSQIELEPLKPTRSESNYTGEWLAETQLGQKRGTTVAPAAFPLAASSAADLKGTEPVASESQGADFWSTVLALDTSESPAKGSPSSASADTPLTSARETARSRRNPATVSQPEQNQALRQRVRRGHSPQSASGTSPGVTARAASGVPRKRLRKWVPWAIAFLLGTGVVAGALALGRLFNPRPDEAVADNPTAAPLAQPENSTTVRPSGTIAGTATGTTAGAANSPSPAGAQTAASSSGTSAPSASPSPTATTAPAQGAGSPASSGTGTQAKSQTAAAGPLSQSDAKQLIQTWQDIKAEAMGEGHRIDRLKEVLAEPILAQWQYSVDQDKQNQRYWKYTLDQLSIVSATPQGTDQSLIKADVKETGEYFERGKLVKDRSYTDSYRVQYSSLRKGQQWMIRDIQVLR